MATLLATGFVALQISITALILGFTTRDSWLRSLGLFQMIYCAYLQMPYIAFLQNSIIRGFAANAPFVLVILYTNKILLDKWTFTERGPTSSVGGLNPKGGLKIKRSAGESVVNDNAVQRMWFGLSISLEARFPATKWPVKNIPPFSGTNVRYIPSKVEFLRANIIRWIAYVLILDLAGFFNKGNDNDVLFGPTRIPFFSRVDSISMEEAMTRTIVVMSFWAFQYIVIEVVYGAFAMIAVGSGISRVEAWPPMFGFISDSYSLRQFWGYFYHQLLRRGCGSIAHAITYTLLRLRRGGFIGRYLFILLTFAISGVFHTFSDISQGIGFKESGAMIFFCIQALGIVVEDGVKAMVRSPKEGEQRGNVLFGWRKVTGYLWVLLWLSWTTPKWTYPMMQRDSGGPILPFSLVAVFFGNH